MECIDKESKLLLLSERPKKQDWKMADLEVDAGLEKGIR